MARVNRTFAIFSAAACAAAILSSSEARAADPEPSDTSSATAAATGSTTAAKPVDWDPSDVSEDPNKKYYFVGLRYRGNVVPAFLEHLFVKEGGTVYSNTIGMEVDIRKDGYSLIPALSFVEYGMDDTLFLQKDKPDNFAGNYSFVHSTLKGIYATADILWSSPIAKDVDFEYGFGIGLGVIFGSLQNNWVYQDPNGQFQASNGLRFSKCPGVGAVGTGCNPADHQNSDVNKVGNYVEKSWVDGGSVPNVFPWIALPQLGFRFKPVKQFEGRLGFGFSLTGFWFGLSGNYGLEKRPETTPAAKTGSGPTIRFGN
jgi:hypothetical protein